MKKPTSIKLRGSQLDGINAALKSGGNLHAALQEACEQVLNVGQPKPKITQLDRDPGDSWVQAELYRWQHGNLPGEPGTKQLPMSVSAGLRGMADAIATKDAKNFPDPFNVMMVLRYAAKLLDR